LVVVVLLVAVAAPVRSDVPRDHTTRCQRRARRPRITAGQRAAIRHRHVRVSSAELRRWMAMTPPPLDLRAPGAASPFVMTPDATGVFDAAALATAQEAFRYRVDGSTHAVHPRLLSLVYAAVRHFRVPYVHVISGYRSGNPTSRHAMGRAIDFVLPGVTDTSLAAWARRQGFVGVGIYPTSGFVHMDVRSRSYFWRDTSGPSERSREFPILRSLAARYDREARERGEAPTAEEHADADEDDASETDGTSPSASDAGVR
jgi:hypothetical protein